MSNLDRGVQVCRPSPTACLGSITSSWPGLVTVADAASVTSGSPASVGHHLRRLVAFLP
jgi:hypothetical protein